MWQFAQDRDGGEFLHIFSSVNGCVEESAQIDNACGQAEADDQGDEDDIAVYGRNGYGTAHGVFNYAHVGFVDGQLEGHFFALVEQVGIEGGLECLLALNAECLLFLFGCCADLSVECGFGGAGLVDLKFDGTHVALHRRDDAGAQGGELAIKFGDGLCGFVGIGGKAVAFVHLRVVLRDLCIGGGHAEGGNELFGLALVAQELQEIARHLQLCFGFDDFVACIGGLVDNGLCCLLEVDQVVLLLELGHFALHVAQFGTDDADALIDEGGGVLCHAVFVLHHVVLVGSEHFVEQVLGALFAVIVAGQEYEGTFLVVFSSRQFASEAFCGHLDGRAAYLHVLVGGEACRLGRAVEGERADGGAHGRFGLGRYGLFC